MNPVLGLKKTLYTKRSSKNCKVVFMKLSIKLFTLLDLKFLHNGLHLFPLELLPLTIVSVSHITG